MTGQKPKRTEREGAAASTKKTCTSDKTAPSSSVLRYFSIIPRDGATNTRNDSGPADPMRTLPTLEAPRQSKRAHDAANEDKENENSNAGMSGSCKRRRLDATVPRGTLCGAGAMDRPKAIGWSRDTCETVKHKCQSADRPSSTVCREWARSSKESHVKDVARKLVRRLHVDEVALIQGFEPSWFEVPEVSYNDRIAAIGNAVPPPVARAIFRAIGEVVEFKNKTTIDICAGAGGLALGTTALTGFEHLALVDFWDVSVKILANGKNDKPWAPAVVHCADVTTFDYGSFAGRVGVLSGGPPCQPFSSGSKRQLGREDERDIFRCVPDIVRDVRPEVFLFENVPGLKSERNAEYFDEILRRLRSPGDGLKYAVNHRVVNAVNHGVPQHRKRLFTIGLQNGSARDIDKIFARLERNAAKGSPRTVGDILLPDERSGPWLSWPFDSLV